MADSALWQAIIRHLVFGLAIDFIYGKSGILYCIQQVYSELGMQGP